MIAGIKKMFERTVSAQPAETVPEALHQCLHVTLPQAGLACSAATFICVLASVFHAYAWLGLFGLCALPLCVCSTTLALGQALWKSCRNWLAAWLLLIVTLVLCSGISVWLYLTAMQYLSLKGLTALQSSASAFLVGLLGIGLPLWKAHTQFRSWQWANLKQTALSAELKALQAQIEPHFLFNTLANTRYLARHDPAQAVNMLDHLIAYLQSALPDLRNQLSTLEREFELARHYLELMTIRFGARLQYQIDYAPELSHASIPPLLLMSLLENAIKHGVEPQPGSVLVSLKAQRMDQQLHICVCDNGVGLSQTIFGHGIGLRNLRERLFALYGATTQVTLRTLDDGFTEASFTMPLHFVRTKQHA